MTERRSTLPRIGSRWHKGKCVGWPGAQTFRVVAIILDPGLTRVHRVIVTAEWWPRRGWQYEAFAIPDWLHRVEIGLVEAGPLPRKALP